MLILPNENKNERYIKRLKRPVLEYLGGNVLNRFGNMDKDCHISKFFLNLYSVSNETFHFFNKVINILFIKGKLVITRC